MIIDSYIDGLELAIRATSITLGAATILTPMATGALLIHRTTRWATTSTIGWRIRATLATRRHHRTRPNPTQR